MKIKEGKEREKGKRKGRGKVKWGESEVNLITQILSSVMYDGQCLVPIQYCTVNCQYIHKNMTSFYCAQLSLWKRQMSVCSVCNS